MINIPSVQEDKEQRFRRIAQLRTKRILNSLRLLGNTANRNTYRYTDEQVEKIFTTVESKLIETRGKFKRNRDEIFEL